MAYAMGYRSFAAPRLDRKPDALRSSLSLLEGVTQLDIKPGQDFFGGFKCSLLD